MTDTPDPHRDEWITRIVRYWDKFLQFNLKVNGYKELRATHEEEQGQLDKADQDITAMLCNDKEKPRGEVFLIMSRHTEVLDRKMKLLEEEHHSIQKTDREAFKGSENGDAQMEQRTCTEQY